MFGLNAAGIKPMVGRQRLCPSRELHGFVRIRKPTVLAATKRAGDELPRNITAFPKKQQQGLVGASPIAGMP